MGRKKAKRHSPEGPSPGERAAKSAKTSAEGRVGNNALASLAELKVPKKRAAPEKKAPPKKPPPPEPVKHPKGGDLTEYDPEDRTAFHDAFAGVTPLGKKTKTTGKKRRMVRPDDREARRKAARAAHRAVEEQARARLDQLVAGGSVIEVRRNADGGVEGLRRGAPQRTLRMLAQGELSPEARLDLHGYRKEEVARALNRFARKAHGEGRRTLCLIHGKGSHSEGGRGVLEDAVVNALSKGGAAPLVEAFVTAPTRFGGHGAIVVRMRERFR